MHPLVAPGHRASTQCGNQLNLPTGTDVCCLCHFALLLSISENRTAGDLEEKSALIATCRIIFQPSVSRPGMGLHVARARPRPTRSFGPHDADGPPQRNSYIYEYITINIHSKEVSEAYCEAVNGDFPNASHEQNTFPRGNYVPRAYKRREIIGSPQFNILHVYWLHYQQLIKLKEMFLKNFLFSFSLWRS